MIYLDHSATTPIDPRVLEAMLPWLSSEYGNPSSIHQMGRKARVAVEDARAEVAHALGAHPAEIFFTSGGTEGNNTILRSAVADSNLVDCVYCSAIEHHSVLDVVHSRRGKGAKAGVLGVDERGVVSNEMVLEVNAQRTLLSIMYVNNETGVVQDLPALRAAAPDVLFHSDAVQAIGKVPVHVAKMGLDFATASAHKINGPKGVGFMFIRRGIDFKPLFLGGGQERNRRAGTENVASIIGLQVAFRLAMAEMEQRVETMVARISELRSGLELAIPGIRVNTPTDRCAPHILNISFPWADGFLGETTLQHLDMRGICVSNGSACVSGSQQPSHVLEGIGLSTVEASAGVRLSVGHQTTKQEIAETVTIMSDVCRSLRV